MGNSSRVGECGGEANVIRVRKILKERKQKEYEIKLQNRWSMLELIEVEGAGLEDVQDENIGKCKEVVSVWSCEFPHECECECRQ